MGSIAMETLPLPEFLERKYAAERDKRLRSDGNAQYLNLIESDRFKHLEQDPWVDHATLNAQEPPMTDGSSCKIFILGAGYSGLVYAARLIEAGFAAEDIRLADRAGGFGGTWYWNRYPGLMCDIESYIYLPLLEETGYMPKHKYSYGPELLEHAERVAAQFDLTDKALFRTTVERMQWDAVQRRWLVSMTQDRGPDQAPLELAVQAQFVITAPGILNHPKVPKIPGLDEFQGHTFHTARWDYNYTGGSPTDPALTGLKEKKVGIIGTGATAIQAVPELARWAKELYVFQRTPARVDVRGQTATDAALWTGKIASKAGWQLARRRNFNAALARVLVVGEEEDLVADGWCATPSAASSLGSPLKGIISPDKVAEHVAEVYALDQERSEKVRARVAAIVRDPDTAEKLKPWYPAWCKRPGFHDEYLAAFNRPNVHLVDTDGRGVERINRTGVVVANGAGKQQYDIDLLLLSTGYRAPAAHNGSPAAAAKVDIIGRDGRSLEEKYLARGVSTLHGISSHGFPNLFFFGASQAASAFNLVFMTDVQAQHVAYILAEAMRRQQRQQRHDSDDAVVVEVTEEAEEEWAAEVVKRAAWFAVMVGCTPSWLNGEGAASIKSVDGDVREQVKKARAAPWGEGIRSYEDVLQRWREEGSLKGITITV
ncbi:uncharacterized protein Z520_01760 [Fonsecaea multimorphosa CBS 102226]|uniref:FAD/NAD(P)-binding domain-containing protein n=1 Tax=Fonsecaea multimorphosa CBS 102226 TaxID=1442371 RepID=A0A0D2KB86_9EURO|nr:uncharacterized protein Z520_01760 [Fonsecaea multimorphosa CBS 102226]KIY03293.1 hypothetical protein Z520_01760 [Fonsecaea multimorphosa CBS 102226]OAL30211.1 hypothetical protein AYO22_01727 [Fonsecaea multimorphosa]